MLTGKQKHYLRAIGHNLKPLVLVGKKEIEDSLIQETNAALDSHELIKIKLLESCMLDKREAARILAEVCKADIAQILGKTILLYRPAEKSAIALPQGEKSSLEAVL